MEKTKSVRPAIPADDYWMGLAFVIAAQSRSEAQCGAVIVSPANQLISTGYDSPPKSMPGGEFFRSAEQAAVDAARDKFVGATLYSTRTPDPTSLLRIAEVDIRRVVYFHTEVMDAVTEDFLTQSSIEMVEFSGNMNWLRDHVARMKSLSVFW